jgi:hypothetical protein
MLEQVEHLQAVALAEHQMFCSVNHGASLRQDTAQDEAGQVEMFERSRTGEQGLLLSLDPELDTIAFTSLTGSYPRKLVTAGIGEGGIS